MFTFLERKEFKGSSAIKQSLVKFKCYLNFISLRPATKSSFIYRPNKKTQRHKLLNSKALFLFSTRACILLFPLALFNFLSALLIVRWNPEICIIFQISFLIQLLQQGVTRLPILSWHKSKKCAEWFYFNFSSSTKWVRFEWLFLLFSKINEAMVIINEGVQKNITRERRERAAVLPSSRHKCPLIYYQNRIIGHLTL